MTTPRELAKDVTGLVTLPEIYIRIRDTINDPKSSIADLADIVSQDPNFASRILRIANSSFFGFATEITSISRAITFMGLADLHDLVLATSIVRSFKGVSSQLIDMKDYWKNSVFCAVIARLLAVRCNVLDSERLFVSGLLHDVGHLIIYIKLPTEATEILANSKMHQWPVVQLERQVLGFDYADVGGELLKNWHMPQGYIEAIACHTNLKTADDFLLDAAIIHIASVLVQQEECNKKGYGIPQFDPLAWQVTNLTEDDLEPIKREAQRNMLEVLRMLFTKPS